LPHFYINPSQIANGRFTLSGDEAHHLLRVLRVKPGEHIALFDGEGRQYSALIERADSRSIEGIIESQITALPPLINVHLYCCVPKGGRFDWLVEKCAEIGVSAITPIISGRSAFVDITDEKINRWRRLSLSAGKQCGRAQIMPINSCLNFNDALRLLPPASIGLLPWEGEESTAINDTSVKAGSLVAVFIGPEGGFSTQEVDSARYANVLPVTLGQSILRVETAAIIASVIVLNAAGQFSGK